ncbi:hypothetical protein A2U01_0076007, partial [Trifolium medium]|nr:hypothetical protein [Trifolium medium]
MSTTSPGQTDDGKCKHLLLYVFCPSSPVQANGYGDGYSKYGGM